MPVRLGDLNTPAELQQDMGTARDENGNAIPDWQTIARPMLSIRPLGGSRPVIADQVHASTTHLVQMLYRPGVSNVGMRFRVHRVDGERIFNIVSCVDDENRHETLTLNCAERTSQVEQAAIGA